MLKKIRTWLKIDQEGHQNGEDDTLLNSEEKTPENRPQRVVGDGKAVFFGEGTEEEWSEELEKQTGWHLKLKKWGLK